MQKILNKIISILILVVITLILVVSYTENVQEANRRFEENLALERCLVLDKHFTDAVIVDGVPFCRWTYEGTTLSGPLELLIQQMAPKEE